MIIFVEIADGGRDGHSSIGRRETRGAGAAGVNDTCAHRRSSPVRRLPDDSAHGSGFPSHLSSRPVAAGPAKVQTLMSSEIKRLQTGARMSQVVIANGFVHLAGQVPDTAGAPIAVQATEILTRIDALLASAGVDKTRVLTANVWLSDAAHFDAFNAVWDAWVPAGHAPTRACVQALLMKPGLDVEIAVTALA